MYSGEATVTNDQLEGVLKAGDILRVRGLWRSNSGNSTSKKDGVQPSSQKVERDKREQPLIAGQIQKIKLVQPSNLSEKSVDSVEQSVTPVPQNNCIQTMTTTVTATPTSPTTTPKPTERKISEKSEDSNIELETKSLDEPSNEQNKNRENVEESRKKRKSESESTKSKSESGDNVKEILLCFLFIFNEPTILVCTIKFNVCKFCIRKKWLVED